MSGSPAPLDVAIKERSASWLAWVLVPILLVAFYFPWGRPLTAGYQLTSGLSHSVYLAWSITGISRDLAYKLLISALFVNITLMGFIFFYPWNQTEEMRTGTIWLELFI